MHSAQNAKRNCRQELGETQQLWDAWSKPSHQRGGHSIANLPSHTAHILDTLLRDQALVRGREVAGAF